MSFSLSTPLISAATLTGIATLNALSYVYWNSYKVCYHFRGNGFQRVFEEPIKCDPATEILFKQFNSLESLATPTNSQSEEENLVFNACLLGGGMTLVTLFYMKKIWFNKVESVQQSQKSS